jgi:hypothetical protein
LLIWQTFERRRLGKQKMDLLGTQLFWLVYSYTVYFYKHAAFVQEIFVVRYYAA